MRRWLVSLHYFIYDDDGDDVRKVAENMERQARENLAMEELYGGIDISGYVDVVGCGYLDTGDDAEVN
jgi:hypothetical protein